MRLNQLPRLFLSITIFLQGCVMAKPALEDFPLSFNAHCVGRYQIELFSDFKRVGSTYSDSVVRMSTDIAEKDRSNNARVFSGKDRVVQWREFIDKKSSEYASIISTFVVEDLKPNLKTVSFYEDTRKLSNDANARHRFESFFFKDFPEHNIGIGIIESLAFNISRTQLDYQQQFQQKLVEKKRHADWVHYIPWPHKTTGICLDERFVVIPEPQDFSVGYRQIFQNGKQSFVEISVEVFEKGDDESVREVIKEKTGLLSILAGKSMKVAGRDGKIFIGDHKYSKTAREFLWISTDSKAGSIPLAHIEIRGTIEMNNYPEIKPMNGTDVAVGFLKSLQIREGGIPK